jgi:hypothetical protein
VVRRAGKSSTRAKYVTAALFTGMCGGPRPADGEGCSVRFAEEPGTASRVIRI